MDLRNLPLLTLQQFCGERNIIKKTSSQIIVSMQSCSASEKIILSVFQGIFWTEPSFGYSFLLAFNLFSSISYFEIFCFA